MATSAVYLRFTYWYAQSESIREVDQSVGSNQAHHDRAYVRAKIVSEFAKRGVLFVGLSSLRAIVLTPLLCYVGCQ